MNENLPKILLVVCGVLTAGLGYVGYQMNQLKGELENVEVLVARQVTEAKESARAGTVEATQTIEQVREQLAIARREAQAAAMKASAEAERKAETMTKELAESVEKKQQEIVQQAKTEISAVAEQTKAAQENIGKVSTEVSTVKTDLTSTKSQLEQTISNLKSVQGELTGQASLIATNGSEIRALQALGQRTIVEFNLDRRSKDGQMVGDVRLTLRRADPKRNRFTVEVLADDRRTEKKDRTINEPIQFYTARARQPYEVVVNTVGRDTVSGYLSIPKVRDSR
jgi:DNA repair exonuclease SbcCD ATPase subunit